MTVKELIEKLSEFNGDLDVEIHEPYDKKTWTDVNGVYEHKKTLGAFTFKTLRIF